MAEKVTMEVSLEEAKLIRERRARLEQTRYYNNGLEAAARHAESWASQAGGGSGQGGQGWLSFAESLRKLKIAEA